MISIGNSTAISSQNGDLSVTSSNEPVIPLKKVNVERTPNDQHSHQNNKNGEEKEEDKIQQNNIQIAKMSESHAKSDTEKLSATVNANEKDYNEEKELQRASKVV